MATDVSQLVRQVAQSIGRCDPSNTIVIAGTPRGGTTLLLETLRHLEGYKAANEPLMPKFAGSHGFTHRTFMAPGERHLERERYLAAVLSGQMSSPLIWKFASASRTGRFRELTLRRQLVVKFCRLNRMLHWFEERFGVRGIVFTIRHPCAVVGSMLGHPGWANWKAEIQKASPWDLSTLPEDLQAHFRPLVDDIETKADALAVKWCIDNYIPLMHYSSHPWVLSPYERLMRVRQSELRRLANAMGVEAGPQVLSALDRPSSSTRTTLGSDTEAQLTKWQTTLPAETVDRIVGFAARAGLGHLYTKDPDPDYDALNRLQDPRWRWTAPVAATPKAPEPSCVTASTGLPTSLN